MRVIPFAKTVHSNCRPMTMEVEPERSEELSRIVKQHFGHEVLRISEVLGCQGTSNYRVTLYGNRRSFCLRVHQRLQDAAKLEELHALENWILSRLEHRRVLTDQWRAVLTPLPTCNEGTYAEVALGDSQNFVQLNRWVANRYFEGDSPFELEGTVRAQGSLASILAECSSDFELSWSKPYLMELVNSSTSLDMLLTSCKDIDEPWAALLLTPEHRAGLERCEEARIELADEAREVHLSAFLHDAHPHNTFCAPQKCLAIYDFEGVSRSAPKAALGSMLHRFLREYCIFHSLHDPAAVSALLRDAFGWYEATAGELAYDKADVFPRWPLLVNYAKLRIVIAKLCASPAEEEAQFLNAELCKFLGYIRELDSFRFP